MLIYFTTSPQRENLLIHIVERKRFSKERKVLIGVVSNRWCERDVSYKPFWLALTFFVDVFEVINGKHIELYESEEINTKGWDTISKVEATQFLNPLTKFEFIIGIIASYRWLHPIVGITLQLQRRITDAINAYQNEC